MRKYQLICEISNKTGVDYTSTRMVLESFVEVVKYTLVRGDRVTIRGFGTFSVRHRGSKVARNVRANVPIFVPPYSTPKFSPAPTFMQQVKSQSHNTHDKYEINED